MPLMVIWTSESTKEFPCAKFKLANRAFEWAALERRVAVSCPENPPSYRVASGLPPPRTPTTDPLVR